MHIFAFALTFFAATHVYHALICRHRNKFKYLHKPGGYKNLTRLATLDFGSCDTFLHYITNYNYCYYLLKVSDFRKKTFINHFFSRVEQVILRSCRNISSTRLIDDDEIGKLNQNRLYNLKRARKRFN